MSNQVKINKKLHIIIFLH